MTHLEASVGIDFIQKEILSYLKEEGRLEPRALLMKLLGNPNINGTHLSLDDLEKTFNDAISWLIKLGTIKVNCSLDIGNLDAKIIFYMPNQAIGNKNHHIYSLL